MNLEQEQIFQASLQRLKLLSTEDKQFLFTDLYEAFLLALPQTEVFRYADLHDGQKYLIKCSINHILNYYLSNDDEDFVKALCIPPSANQETVDPSLYSLWFDSLLVTLCHYDRLFTRSVEVVWSIYLEEINAYKQMTHQVA